MPDIPPLSTLVTDDGARHIFRLRDQLRARGIEPGNDVTQILALAADTLDVESVKEDS